MKDLLNEFQFPAQVRLDIPITKISLKEIESCTLSDRKLLDGSEIQSIRIRAVLKQETANIAFHKTADESYVEVYVIEVIIQTDVYNKTFKNINRLLHKLIPHHCIIITKSDDTTLYNLGFAIKTISKNSTSLRVIQKELFSDSINFESIDFINHLAYTNANKYDLKAFYNYYIQVIQNYNLMPLMQDFKLRNYEVTDQMIAVQEEIQAYEVKINSAVKELNSTTQMSEKVRINSDIHALKQSIQELKYKLN